MLSLMGQTKGPAHLGHPVKDIIQLEKSRQTSLVG